MRASGTAGLCTFCSGFVALTTGSTAFRLGPVGGLRTAGFLVARWLIEKFAEYSAQATAAAANSAAMSDTDSTDSTDHVHKARKQSGGGITNLCREFEPSNNLSFVVATPRNSARLADDQPAHTGRRTRSAAAPAATVPVRGSGKRVGVTPPPEPAASKAELESVTARLAEVEKLAATWVHTKKDLADTKQEMQLLQGQLKRAISDHARDLAREGKMHAKELAANRKKLAEAQQQLQHVSNESNYLMLVAHGVKETPANKTPAQLSIQMQTILCTVAANQASTSRSPLMSLGDLTATRIGRPDGRGKPRPVVLRFPVPATRFDVLAVSKQLRAQGITLDECLTAPEKQQRAKLAAGQAALKQQGFDDLFERLRLT